MLNAGIYIQCGGTVDSSVAEENGGAVHNSAKDGDIMRILGVAVVAVDGDFLVLVEGAGTVAPLELLILSCLFSVTKENGGAVHNSAKDGDETWVLGVAVVVGDGDFLVEGAGMVTPLEVSISLFSFSVAKENGGTVHNSAKDGDAAWILGVDFIAADGDFLVLVEGAGMMAPFKVSI